MPPQPKQMILNLSLFAYVLGTISSLFMSADEALVATRQQLAAVESFINQRDLPQDLQQEIRASADFLSSQTAGGLNEQEEQEIFHKLSHTLQVDVARYISRGLVQESATFHSCSDNFLDMLSTVLTETTMQPGTTLFRIQDISKVLQIVATGEVELLLERDSNDAADLVVEASLGPGAAVAPIPFFFSVRHTCTARTAANMYVRIFALEKAQYKRLIKLYPGEEEVMLHNILNVNGEPTSDGASTVAPSEASGSSAGSKSDASRSVASSSFSTSMIGDSHTINSIAKSIEKARRKKENERVCALCAAAHKGSLQELQEVNGLGVTRPPLAVAPLNQTLALPSLL